MGPSATRTQSAPTALQPGGGTARSGAGLHTRLRAAGLIAAGLLLTACGTSTPSGPSTAKTAGSGTRQALTEYPAGKRAAAPVLSGATITGDRLNLAALRGKVIVLNVWGSWCAPCRAEAPALKKASDETYDLGVRFVGIDIRDNDAAARAFERTYGITYPSFRDPDGELLQRFNGRIPVSAVPSTVFIDRDGRIAARIIGQTTYRTLRDLANDIATENAKKSGGGAAQ